MKYPRINRKQLDELSRKKFDIYYETIFNSIRWDTDNFKGDKLLLKEIELLSYNATCNLILNVIPEKR